MTEIIKEYSYESAPTLGKFSACNSRIRGIMGPFGSGKSTACVMEIFQRALEQKPGGDGIRRTRWAVIRNSYPQLKDTTIKTLHDWLPPGKLGYYNKTDHDYIINRIPGVEIEIMFRALDRPEHVANLLSLELTGAWINEAREVPYAIIEALTGRVGRFPSMRDGGATWYGIIMDTNPPDSDNWWYNLFEERKPSNATLFKQPSGLSPKAENIIHLPDGYYKDLADGKDPEFIKVYVEGEYGYVQDGKPVYPEYKDSMHCREFELTPGLPIYRGWDFGLTPACVMAQFTPMGQLRVFDEYVSDNIGVDRFADNLISYCNSNYNSFVIGGDNGDPAGGYRSDTNEGTCFDILRAKNINIEPAEQTPQIRQESVKRGLNTLSNGEPSLIIHPRCKMIRKGFQGRYKYRRIHSGYGKYSDKPEKNDYSHPHDALQYLATRFFARPLTANTDQWKKLEYSNLGIV